MLKGTDQAGKRNRMAMELNYKEIGRKIKDARDRAGLTQEKLAEKADLSITHVSAIENANSKFSLRALANIASELDLSIDYLVFDSHSTKVFENEAIRILSDCSEQEARTLLFLLKTNKIAIREFEK